MEPCISISFLNDFIFCPRSIYFHQIYKTFDTAVYHRDIQTKGRIAHLNIDNKKYSTKKDILQGFPVYSAQYSLFGKIDLFDQKSGELIERKKRIKKVYDGFVFQIYAQYYCLTEMGYSVKKLRLHSLDNNKGYPILLPKDDQKMNQKFNNLLQQIKDFNLEQEFLPNINKCKKCIYKSLCDACPLEAINKEE